MPNRKTRNQKPTKLIRNLLSDKRAISVALTTMIITAGVIAAGIAVLYWAYSWGNIANQEYSQTISNNQNATSERLAFEYISYSDTNSQLTVYVINCGKVNNLEIARIYIWDNSQQIIGTYESPTLLNIDDDSIITNGLNINGEGKAIIPNIPDLSGYYTLRVVTERGRTFDGSFSAP